VRWDVGEPANAIDPKVAPPSVPNKTKKKLSEKVSRAPSDCELTSDASECHQNDEKPKRRPVEPLTATIFAWTIRCRSERQKEEERIKIIQCHEVLIRVKDMQSHEASKRANEGKIHNSPAEKETAKALFRRARQHILKLNNISCLIYADSKKILRTEFQAINRWSAERKSFVWICIENASRTYFSYSSEAHELRPSGYYVQTNENENDEKL
jgi:hypothetical protein